MSESMNEIMNETTGEKVNEAAMEPAKEKKKWDENEAPVSKWILTLVLGLVLGIVFMLIIQAALKIVPIFIPELDEGGKYAIVGQMINMVLPFLGLYLGVVIIIRAVAKTSFKAFVLGTDAGRRVVYKKDTLPVLGLYLVGLIIGLLPTAKNIKFSGNSLETMIMIIVLCLLFVWMQTGFEEIVFRGIPLRMVCKSNIGICKKAIITSIISSALFMMTHGMNPEVTSMKGIDAAISLSVYFAAGFLLALVDMIAGNLLPGLLIHLFNNLFTFMIISGSVSAGGASSIWIDTTEMMPLYILGQTILAYAPVLIYLGIKYKKNKR